jgi:hypothetical protein
MSAARHGPGFRVNRKIGYLALALKGHVKPGAPAVVTLSEVLHTIKKDADGLEAILYIPPWWPNLEYDYDLISGTLVVGGIPHFAIRGPRHQIF